MDLRIWFACHAWQNFWYAAALSQDVQMGATKEVEILSRKVSSG